MVGIVGNRLVTYQETVAVTSVGQVKSLTKAFSYDSPVLLSVAGSNAPATGGQTMTFSGLNFGTHSHTAFKGRIGGTACVSTAWDTVSSIVCKLPAGVHSASGETSAGRAAVLTVGAEKGSNTLRKTLTFSQAFTYDAPVLKASFDASNTYRKGNGPATGGTTITLQGENFGAQGYSSHIAVGGTTAQSVAWTSDTELLVRVSPGIGSNRDLTISVVGRVGTLAAQFDFDPPTLTATVGYNGPATGGSLLTFFGINFGVVDFTSVAKVGVKMCAKTEWTSDSSVTRNPVP